MHFPKIVMIDCQTAGVAGDMILGALLDLGADKNKVIKAIKSLEKEEFGYKNIVVDIQKVMRSGFRATKIDVTAEEKDRKDGNRLIQIVEETANNLPLSKAARQYAINVIRTLVNAEAKLHGREKAQLSNAHLHEVGLVDTAAEIIGSAVALDDLGLLEGKILTSTVAVGGGTFQFSHGIVSAPSPATLTIFESYKIPIKGGPAESELSTPTGAAILVNLASEACRFYPEMIPDKVGYGAGTKNFHHFPNILRIIVGQPMKEEMNSDEVAVLETNIDDMSGEFIGNSLEQLYLQGAKDVSIIPMQTKKNRPGQIIKIVADKKDVQHLAQTLINETGTLGVRVYFCQRHIVNRESHSIDILVHGVKESIRVKVSKEKTGKITRVKPEFEDLKRLSEKTNVSARALSELILAKAREIFNLDA